MRLAKLEFAPGFGATREVCGGRGASRSNSGACLRQAVSATEREELFAEHRRDREKKEKEAKRVRRAARTAAFRELLASFKGIKVGGCCSCVQASPAARLYFLPRGRVPAWLGVDASQSCPAKSACMRGDRTILTDANGIDTHSCLQLMHAGDRAGGHAVAEGGGQAGGRAGVRGARQGGPRRGLR